MFIVWSVCRSKDVQSRECDVNLQNLISLFSAEFGALQIDQSCQYYFWKKVLSVLEWSKYTHMKLDGLLLHTVCDFSVLPLTTLFSSNFSKNKVVEVVVTQV